METLLKVLKKYHPELPSSKKTLMQSSLKFSNLIKKFNSDNPSDDSKFVYIGIARNLINRVYLENYLNDKVKLQFNIDGLPLFKSSSIEFHPILGKIHDKKIAFKPFTIAVYCGIGAPHPVDHFLSEFVDELNYLLENGVVIGCKSFKVLVHCFICDKPARSLIKCIIHHGGYFACERCVVEGIYYNKRVVYPSTSCALRTDKSFRSKNDSKHHQTNKTSPLTRIIPKIDMVKLFLLDIMHLVFLGVMKKFFGYWLGTGLGKLKKEDIIRISQRLMNISDQVPVEFQRTTRSLGEIAKWKATEFRFFLLYCGIFVLMGILPDNNFKHFTLLHVATRILSCEDLLRRYACKLRGYLKVFVLASQKLYGLESQILNVHSLVHVVDDVKTMSCSLSHLTAFPFENLLGKIKKSLRSGYKPLEQLCNSLEEELYEPVEENLDPCKLSILKSSKKNFLLNITRLKYMNYEIHVKEPNNRVFLSHGSIIQIENIVSTNTSIENVTADTIKLFGKKFEKSQSAYKYPCDSSLLSTFSVEEPKKGEENCEFLLSDIQCKAVILKIFEIDADEKKIFAMPLLH